MYAAAVRMVARGLQTAAPKREKRAAKLGASFEYMCTSRSVSLVCPAPARLLYYLFHRPIHRSLPGVFSFFFLSRVYFSFLLLLRGVLVSFSLKTSKDCMGTFCRMFMSLFFFFVVVFRLSLSLSLSQNLEGMHGDHLYKKGDFEGAMQQYQCTIGHLDPSYVIRRFLDAQRIGLLTSYLEGLHDAGQASSDHTTLLLNCHTKLKVLLCIIRTVLRLFFLSWYFARVRTCFACMYFVCLKHVEVCLWVFGRGGGCFVLFFISPPVALLFVVSFLCFLLCGFWSFVGLDGLPLLLWSLVREIPFLRVCV